jgi:nicotinamide mononucleotide transporter
MDFLIPFFTRGGAFTLDNGLEIVAVATGLLSVWYARKENILVYPVGIVSVLLYVYLCFKVKLYADMGINAIYFIMSVYGWYKWAKKDLEQHHLPISRCTPREYVISIAGIAFFFILLSYILVRFTDSTVPYWDAFTTAVFIIGMWLMAVKKIENWIAWLIGDAIVIPLFFVKGLALSSLQYLVFLILAVMGFISWRKKLLHPVTNA